MYEPWAFVLHLYIINDAEQCTGDVEIAFSLGQLIDEDTLQKRIDHFIAEEMPAGFRLMSSDEALRKMTLDRL